MTSPEQWAEVAVENANEKRLPLMVLGGANDDFGDAVDLAAILHQAGERFGHVNAMQCWPRAVYVVAAKDERYGKYGFAHGSVVIDPYGVVPQMVGVQVFRPAVPEPDEQLELDLQ